MQDPATSQVTLQSWARPTASVLGVPVERQTLETSPRLVHDDPDDLLGAAHAVVEIEDLQLDEFYVLLKLRLSNGIRRISDEPAYLIPDPPCRFLIPPITHKAGRTQRAMRGTAIEIEDNAHGPRCGQSLFGSIDRQENVEATPIPLEARGICHGDHPEALQAKLFP